MSLRPLSVLLLVALTIAVVSYELYVFTEMFTRVQVIAEPNHVK